MGKHVLQWKQALPAETPDKKVYDVLQSGRQLLFELSGRARDIEYKHKVSDQDAQLGGPLGQKIRVTYLEVWARFDQPDFALPGETQGLLQQYRFAENNRSLIEAANKAIADQRAEQAKAAKEAVKNQPDFRDDPTVESAPAHTVQLDKMLISDAELARTSATPAGVTVFDGPMFPASDGEVH